MGKYNMLQFYYGEDFEHEVEKFRTLVELDPVINKELTNIKTSKTKKIGHLTMAIRMFIKSYNTKNSSRLNDQRVLNPQILPSGNIKEETKA